MTTDRRRLWYLTLSLILVWAIDTILRQNPTSVSTPWIRDWINAMYLSPSFSSILSRPWTLLTYSLLHNSGLHLLLNFLLLWLFAPIQLHAQGWRSFISSYLGGIAVGGICFVAVSELLRASGLPLLGLPLVGASAAMIAIAGSVVAYRPTAEVPLPVLGSLQSWQVGLFVVLLLLLAYGGYNVGGLIAHLSGLLWGLALGLWHRHRTRSIAARLRVSATEREQYRELLDKVQRSGYQSLSEEEKTLLVSYHDTARHDTKQ